MRLKSCLLVRVQGSQQGRGVCVEIVDCVRCECMWGVGNLGVASSGMVDVCGSRIGWWEVYA